MRFLLDTNACIRYLRVPHSSIRRRIVAQSPNDIVLCVIVKAELFYGARRSNDPLRSFRELATFFAPYVSLPLDDAAAEVAGQIRADLARVGTLISPHDLLIAAIALANDLTLVTHNTHEFRRVAGLRLEDWEAAP